MKQIIPQILIANYWFWIAVAEVLIILFLFIKLRRNSKKVINTVQADLSSWKNTDIDMDDLMTNINKSKELYKKLSTKCHPDRFLDEELNKKAGSLFQEITKDQRNYKRLLELKEKAEHELGIIF